MTERNSTGKRVAIVIVSIVLVVSQALASLSFALSRSITPTNVELLVVQNDVISGLASSATATVTDANQAELITSLLADDEVQRVLASYLGEVVQDVRNGSHIASLDTFSMRQAIFPYLEDFVAQMYPDLVAAYPAAVPYLQCAAADQVISGLNAQMGDWHALLAGAGVAEWQVSAAGTVLSDGFAAGCAVVSIVCGIALVLMRKRRFLGCRLWAVLAGAVGVVAVVAGIASIAMTSYVAVASPLGVALLGSGIVGVALAVVLAIVGFVVRDKA